MEDGQGSSSHGEVALHPGSLNRGFAAGVAHLPNANIYMNQIEGRDQAPESPEDRKKELINSLKFKEMEERRIRIDPASLGTGRWIQETAEWKDWQSTGKTYMERLWSRAKARVDDLLAGEWALSPPGNRDARLLWFKGKPGSGKSTLMKVAVTDTEQNGLEDEIVLSHFFLARGTPIQRSTKGMYRTLLANLLRYLSPDIVDNIAPEIPVANPDEDGKWELGALVDLFTRALGKLHGRPVVCFVDALDECTDDQLTDMVTTLLQLVNSAQRRGDCFRVCFASRHHRHFPLPDNEARLLIIEKHKRHKQDIFKFINGNLVSEDQIAQRIREKLQRKANGSFIYVKLVVELLRKPFASGRLHEAEAKLDQQGGSPNNMSALYELYANTLKRDRVTEEETLQCMLWVLIAQRPLTPAQLWCALYLRTRTLSKVSELLAEVTARTVELYIRDVSKGLLEYTNSMEPTVQFIHETVRDFLSEPDGSGLAILNSVASPKTLHAMQAQGHNSFREMCEKVMLQQPVQTSSALRSPAVRPPAVERPVSDFSRFCQDTVLFHANAAQELGIDQTSFLHNCESRKWFELWIEDPEEGLLHAMVRNSARALIVAWHLSQPSQGHSTDQFGFLPQKNPPILTAIRAGDAITVAAFVQAHLERRRPHFESKSDYSLRLAQRTTKYIMVQDSLELQKLGISLLTRIALDWSEELASFFLVILLPKTSVMETLLENVLSSEGASFANTLQSVLSTRTIPFNELPISSKDVLFCALYSGHCRCLELLLQRNAYLCLPSASFGTVVLDILYSPQLEVGDQRTVFEAHDAWGSAGQARSDTGAIDTWDPQLLVAYQELTLRAFWSSLQVPSAVGWTYLHSLASTGQTPKAEMLLSTFQQGINARDYEGCTPLHCASKKGHIAIVELLLSIEGIEVDARNGSLSTPLHEAASNGHSKVALRLLQRPEVNINARDSEGRTPRQLAKDDNYKETARLLRKEEMRLKLRESDPVL